MGEPSDPLAELTAVEPRWPVALAISAFLVITVVLHFAVPQHQTLGPSWLIPSLEVALLGLLLAADPARVIPRRRWLRPAALLLVVALAAAVFAATVKLITALIEGGTVTNSATSLLACGALAWLGNILVFGLLYWLLDSGGPVARYLHERPCPDFAFSQQLSPELAPRDGGRATSTTSSSALQQAPHSAPPT